VHIDLSGGLAVISRGRLHTRGAIARPGEDSILYGFTFGRTGGALFIYLFNLV
jgi:hypothetical protein